MFCGNFTSFGKFGCEIIMTPTEGSKMLFGRRGWIKPLPVTCSRLEPGTQRIRCHLSILFECVNLQGSFIRIQTLRICRCWANISQAVGIVFSLISLHQTRHFSGRQWQLRCSIDSPHIEEPEGSSASSQEPNTRPQAKAPVVVVRRVCLDSW